MPLGFAFLESAVSGRAVRRSMKRATVAPEVLRTSGDLRSLQAMLGHGNLAVTSIYLSEVDEHKRAAVRGLGWRHS